MKRYPAYKPSGVQWIGEIPEHWEEGRLKLLLTQKITDGPHTTPIFIDEGVPFLSVDGIQEGKLVFEDCRYISITDHNEYKRKAFPKKDDLLLGKAASTGKIARVTVDFEFSIWSPLALIKPNHKKIQSDYLENYLKCKQAQAQIDTFCTLNTQRNISMDDIGRIAVVIPPSSEQISIVSYLDHKNSEIDGFVASKRKLIALLNEERAAFIQKIVLRGLNPDAPMKQTGAMFVGEVPAHWEVKRAKYYFSEIDERSESGDEELLSVSHITGVTPRSEKNVNMFLAESYEGSKVCIPGDLVINTMWAWMGAMGVSRHRGIVSPSYGVYRQRNGSFLPEYLDHLARARSYIAEYICRSTGIQESRLRLYPDQFFNVRMICPPLSEQQAIVAEIEEQSQRIDAAISRIEREIDLINEYRTALISEVVTGKIDVRDRG